VRVITAVNRKASAHTETHTETHTERRTHYLSIDRNIWAVGRYTIGDYFMYSLCHNSCLLLA